MYELIRIHIPENLCASTTGGVAVVDESQILSCIMISNPQGSATRAMGVVPNTNQQNETYLALGLQIPRDKISKGWREGKETLGEKKKGGGWEN